MNVTAKSTDTKESHPFDAPAYGVNVTGANAPVHVGSFHVGVRKAPKKRAPQWKVIRKLRGMVIDTSGPVWLVGFEHDGGLLEYEFPRAELERNRITARFQPFEMDELESTDAGVSGKCYRYRPLAEVDDAYADYFELSPEDAQLRDLIFSKFGNPQT